MKIKTISILCVTILGISSIAHADREVAPAAPAVPVAPAAPAVEKKAFVGIVTEKVSATTAVQLGLESGVGLNVESVVKDSSAEKYGIEKYDILMELDGQWLTSVSHFTTLLRMKKPGDVVTFKILRKGQYIDLDVTLGAKESRKGGSDWEWKFEEKMEEFGQRMEEFAEREELMQHMRERVNPEELGETVRSALEKAQYHINQWVGEDGSHTSIVHSGNARSIITADDGTLIVEGRKDGSSKVIAINNDDEVIFSGVVTKDGDELAQVDEWVKEQYKKLSNKMVKVIVTDDIDIDTEISETIDEAGAADYGGD